LAEAVCISVHLSKGVNHETYVSAEHHPQEADPRFSRPLPQQERPRSSQPPPGQGTEKIGRLDFSRDHRLLRRPEFSACFEAGRRLHSQSFVLFVLPKGQGCWRLGLAVSRKTGSAVRRNRVKRLVREFFRLHRHALPPDVDVVVVPKRGVDGGNLDQAQVTRELLPLLDRLNKGDRPVRSAGRSSN